MREALVRDVLGAIVFALLIGVIIALFTVLEPRAADCGITPVKPVPPVGCKDLRASCVCDSQGDCHWEWVCVR